MSWIRGRISVVVMCALALSGCSGDSGDADSPSSLPQGPQTMRQAADAMRNLQSVRFTLGTEGEPAIPIKGGDVKLLKNGDAQGTLRIEQLGLTLDTDFVLIGDTLYYKGLTGSGFQKAPKERILALYDPSAVLDPERGIAKLLSGVRSPQPEAREKVGGKDAYKIKVTLPKEQAGTLVPGVSQDLAGHVWVATADHRLLKVRGVLPAASGGGDDNAVVVTFTEFDAGYTFTPPV
ncbi:LppX_LprAFG lipoprotein [Thermomonospora umbrina]|uniref:Lipoprotein LprG n=1 Tax=Thermomonospora umbrina TaxID=111806 RepID=A0A3D9T6L9_9ACTN|nr:LppX_LprAFG lipoprotein [Thermomonospora umbrina]REE99411.1 lipoprotein LprG [Thermomonospora umbrina]